MAKKAKQPPKMEEQPHGMEKPSSKRIKDHDIFMRGLFEFMPLAYKILNYAVPAELKPYIDFSTHSFDGGIYDYAHGIYATAVKIRR